MSYKINYTDKTTLFEFGDAKLRAKDIDPLYAPVYHGAGELQWDAQRKAMYVFAFVAFDHAGLAAKIVQNSESDTDFWAQMRMANERETIRGQPRRYFRGDKATASLNWFETKYLTPYNALNALKGHYYNALEIVTNWWPHFGPTAAWKIADMAERCVGIEIDFSDVTLTDLITNDQVKKGVAKAMVNQGNVAFDRFEQKLRRYEWASAAGPAFDRPIGPQEWETMLCYYSHDAATNKHFPGNDRQLIMGELAGWGEVADILSENLS